MKRAAYILSGQNGQDGQNDLNWATCVILRQILWIACLPTLYVIMKTVPYGTLPKGRRKGVTPFMWIESTQVTKGVFHFLTKAASDLAKLIDVAGNDDHIKCLGVWLIKLPYTSLWRCRRLCRRILCTHCVSPDFQNTQNEFGDLLID